MDEHGYALTEIRLNVGPALSQFTEREQRIITMGFYGNLMQTEITAQIGVSQLGVSQMNVSCVPAATEQWIPAGVGTSNRPRHLDRSQRATTA